jgi:uncharacterized repeat protein (TIGR02543 family)
MLGVAVASAIALTGCDDVLAEIQKGLLAANTPAYGIALSKEAYVFPNADAKLALRVINIGTEPTGVLTAELFGDSEAFKLSKKILPSIKFGRSISLTVTAAAELAAETYDAVVVVSGANGIEATLEVSFTVEEAEEPVTDEDDAEADDTVTDDKTAIGVDKGSGEDAAKHGDGKPETETVTEQPEAEKIYTVTFDLNYTGAPNPSANQEIAEGKYAERPANPVRTGYTFGGWFTDAAGTNKWDFDINTVKWPTTLYAKWTRNTYTVTFNTGNVEPTPVPLPAVPHASTITNPAVTKTGHILDGWYKETAKITKWNFNTDTVKEDITLYGTWTGRAVWLESKETTWSVTNGSAVSIFAETTSESEYTSYTDETHYTYKRSSQSGTTIYEYEMSRNGVSAHEVDITRYANGNVNTAVVDSVYDADSGLVKQYTSTKTTTSSSGVTSSPSVTEFSYTVILQNTAADGTKPYKRYVTSTGGIGNYSIYTIKDGVTLSELGYNAGSLLYTRTYTFPDHPVIRERLPKLTLESYTSASTPSSSRYETCELLASTDTTLSFRINQFYSSNSLRSQSYYTYTKRTLP